MPDNIFKTTDIYGRRITLPENTWKYHIAVEHPEMSGYLARIQKTVEEPKLILERQARNTLIYATLTPSKLYVNVYVGFDDTKTEGTIRTAHLSTTILSGSPIYIKK
ncbi:MAG: hypothetical protein ACYC6Q_04415 [Syntrophales bacterium]